jgi:response regulator RpfG family c-di-GMP phosphodiesterase
MSDPDQRTTILVVDDEPANLVVLTQVLQPHYRVRAARSGELALRAVVSEPRPDLVLLDIMMPEMDGYTVLTKMRELPGSRDTPVIFVTAMSADEDEQRGFELGAVDYLTKPIRPAIVLARIQAQLELKEARDRLADQNAELEAKVAERTTELKEALSRIEATHASLKKTYFGTLMAISTLAELRGARLGAHARHVSEISRQVAQQMGMSATEVQDVFVAAMLHDIGMIGLTDDLLSKPVSTMNRAESLQYRRHPAMGADALKRIEALAGIADMVRYHHEHYDGSGYPEGRSALNIPLGARIIGAVSDYDSLMYGSLTAQPMSSKQSCQYLMDSRGSRYDPMVLDKLVPILAREGQFEVDEIPVNAHNLQEGMQLTRDVMHQDGFLLLSKNTIMTRSLIDQLVAVEKQAGVDLRVFVLRQPQKT